MDVIILCGGKGTRLSEETRLKPKPMVEIGGMPILWHIMKLYSYYGFKRFILALGYKSEIIKDYFNNTISENDWEIEFINTGQNTLKGARIKKCEKYIRSHSFHLTYGDGICDVNILSLTKFHNSHNRLGTVTAVRPPSRFGELDIDKNNQVIQLEEKPQMGKGLINGGFFIFEKEMLNYLSDDQNCDFEFGPLQKITKDGQLKAYKQENGFWQCMDNVRERDLLNNKINNNNAPWMVWENKNNVQ